MLIVSLIIYAVGKGCVAAWYERAKLEESQSGRLDESLKREQRRRRSKGAAAE